MREKIKAVSALYLKTSQSFNAFLLYFLGFSPVNALFPEEIQREIFVSIAPYVQRSQKGLRSHIPIYVTNIQ